MGSIVLANSTNSGTASLSTPAQTDWLQIAQVGAPNRKAGGGRLISEVIALGPTGLQAYSGDAVTITWSDGSPVAAGSSSAGVRGIGVEGSGYLGDGFAFAIDAGTTTRTAVIYWSVFSGAARINVALTDDSAPIKDITVVAPANTAQDFATTITYSADSDNEQLTVGMFLSAPATAGANVRMQAAKVVNGVPPQPVAPPPVSPPPPTALPYKPAFEAQFDPDRAQLFIIENLLRTLHTATLVRVLAVRPSAFQGGFVDVQPLILETATNSAVIEQSPIYNVPYVRYQGGSSAVILDPVAGDIGLCIFAERDITNVKQTAAEGAAPTQRAYSSADGLYIGGVLNPKPSQYVFFQPDGAGISIVSPGVIGLQANGAVNLIAGDSVLVQSGTTLTLAAGSSMEVTAATTLDINVTGQATVEAAGWTFNCPVTFAQTVTGTATSSGAVTFGAPVTAPDFIAPNAKLNTHQHAVSGSSTTGNPHN